MKRGLLLINLGTPDDPTPAKVRAYLGEFLMDPDVIDIPFPLRWLLVSAVILPTRPAKSAEAYRKIWTDRGSPLLFHSEDLAAKVQKLMPETEVRLAMRYGKPSMESAYQKFSVSGVTDLTVLPLYPQYSMAATESSLKLSRKLASQYLPGARVREICEFYNHPGFINAFVEVAKPKLASQTWDHFLFSFHGLPERQLRKTDPSGQHCFSSQECSAAIGTANLRCYRAQCYATAHSLASRLGIPKEKYHVCFQSRLGRTPWIKPFTDELYVTLPQKGLKKVAVLCPSFVADCLETLEEIEIRGNEDFRSHGGEKLELVPSLNSTDRWAEAVAEIAQGR